MEIFNEKDCSPLFRKFVKGIREVCFDLVRSSLKDAVHLFVAVSANRLRPVAQPVLSKLITTLQMIPKCSYKHEYTYLHCFRSKLTSFHALSDWKGNYCQNFHKKYVQILFAMSSSVWPVNKACHKSTLITADRIIRIHVIVWKRSQYPWRYCVDSKGLNRFLINVFVYVFACAVDIVAWFARPTITRSKWSTVNRTDVKTNDNNKT